MIGIHGSDCGERQTGSSTSAPLRPNIRNILHEFTLDLMRCLPIAGLELGRSPLSPLEPMRLAIELLKSVKQ